MKNIDFSPLPRYTSGNNKGNINWISSIGTILHFTYDDITSDIKIIDYNPKGQFVTIQHENRKHIITTGNLLTCSFGPMLDKNTKEYRFKMNDLVFTKSGYLKILEYTRKSNLKAYKCQCMNCNDVTIKTEDKLLEACGCVKCNDSISYPEKFVANMLKQLDISYEREKRFSWSNQRRYDFYISSIDCIIETHGAEHYIETHLNPLEKVIKTDSLKRNLASQNKMTHYIELDCKISDPNYIANSVINSKLSDLFDVSLINWEECHINSCFSYVKVVSDIWNDGFRSSYETSDLLNIRKSMVIAYYKKATKLGMMQYNKAEMIEANLIYRNKERSGKKKIMCITTGKVFNSITEATNYYSICRTGISDYLSGKKNLKSIGKHPITGEGLTWKLL